ncbi:MAG: FAD-dependent oxidoreductase [Gemmataceae bacterium]
MSRHVVVVGAGVIGAACAYYLSKRGWAVTILDGAGFGEGCSHANCGYVSPSHVLPLAGPGAILSTLKTALRRNSPIRLKPRLDPALWRWLLRFARRCNRRDMLAAGKAIQALLNSSRRLYEELIREEGIDCDWEARGVLFVLRSAAAMAHFGEIDHLLRTHFDLPAERWNAAELTDREPALKPGLAGAWHYPGDAHLRPDRLMSAWRRVLERRGVRFVRANVETLCGERRGVSPTCRAVRTADGNVPADAFVFATGALTPLLQGGSAVPF